MLVKEKKYRINKGFITQKVGTSITIFSAETSELLTLNDSAAVIFQGLKLQWDEQKIIKKIVSIYEVTAEKASSDFAEFKQLLLDKKILVSR